MKDTIERQAAIDVLNSFDVLDGHTDKEEIKERIERLPSAQPTFDARDTQYNLPIGTDLISRAEAIDVVSKWFEKIELNADICLDGLRTLPSVQPKTDDNLKFLEFLWNRVNPNKMEQYLEMYQSQEVKTNE